MRRIEERSLRAGLLYLRFAERAYALRLAGGASLTERAEVVYVHCIFGGPTVSAFALLAPLNRPIEKYFYIGIRYIEI